MQSDDCYVSNTEFQILNVDGIIRDLIRFSCVRTFCRDPLPGLPSLLWRYDYIVTVQISTSIVGLLCRVSIIATVPVPRESESSFIQLWLTELTVFQIPSVVVRKRLTFLWGMHSIELQRTRAGPHNHRPIWKQQPYSSVERKWLWNSGSCNFDSHSIPEEEFRIFAFFLTTNYG